MNIHGESIDNEKSSRFSCLDHNGFKNYFLSHISSILDNLESIDIEIISESTILDY